MRYIRGLALALLLLGLAVAAPAHGAAMVFVKKGDVWWESGRGIFSTPVTSDADCGLKPRRIVRGGLTSDLSRANVPRRRRR
jgi:hypothetical protein